jgi:hypothetical protein
MSGTSQTTLASTRSMPCDPARRFRCLADHCPHGHWREVHGYSTPGRPVQGAAAPRDLPRDGPQPAQQSGLGPAPRRQSCMSAAASRRAAITVICSISSRRG